YMFTKPRTAKKLHFDVIPQQVDDYLTYVEKYPAADDAAKLENPAWYIHTGKVPAPESNLKFSLLLNLVSACNAEDKSVLWGFLKRELPNATPENSPMLDKLCGYAVRYYHDFVKPTKQFRAPTELERTALADLRAYLTTVADGTPADEIMTKVYDFGLKYYSKETMRDWFKAMYETLLGSQQGPRMGSFIALFGAKETIALIDNALKQQAAA
ncbi:MAG: lysine--tRNA ligase, partial [Rickettsiales bacterium]